MSADQPLGDEGAVERFEWHHVGNGAQRDEIDEIEEIGLRPRGAPEAAPAQFAVDGDDREENQSDGGQMTEFGEIVEPVRIDDHCIGQLLVSLMMIDDDGVDPEPFRLGKRLQARGPAVHRHQQPGAALGERADRLHRGIHHWPEW
jgi:hypothetical protein